MNLILFLFIAAFFTLSLGEFGQFPFGNTDFSVSVFDILLTLSLSALLVWNIAIKKNLKMPRNFPYLIIFWAIAILSLFFSLDLSGWLYLLRFIIYSTTFYLAFHLVKSKILSLNEFLTLIKITSITLAVLGFVQLIFYPDLGILSDLGYDPHKYRLFSTFLDPNLLGTFLTFGFILTIYELVSKKITPQFFKESKWNIITATILGIAIILTFSRSSYLMLSVSMLFMLALKNRKILAFFAISAIILYFIFPAFNNRIEGALSIDASASERFSSWDKGLIIFQQNPIIGAGFNNIRNYSKQVDLVKLYSIDGGNSGSGVDSSLIFVLATTGITGFLSYAIFLIKILNDLISSTFSNTKFFYGLQLQPIKLLQQIYKLPGLRKWYKEDSGSKKVIKENFLSLPLLAITIGLITNSFFINSLFFPPIMFVWFSFLGVFYGLGEGEGEGVGVGLGAASSASPILHPVDPS